MVDPATVITQNIGPVPTSELATTPVSTAKPASDAKSANSIKPTFKFGTVPTSMTKTVSYAKSTTVPSCRQQSPPKLQQLQNRALAPLLLPTTLRVRPTLAVPLDHLHLGETFLCDLFVEWEVDPPLVLMADDDKLK